MTKMPKTLAVSLLAAVVIVVVVLSLAGRREETESTDKMERGRETKKNHCFGFFVRLMWIVVV